MISIFANDVISFKEANGDISLKAANSLISLKAKGVISLEHTHRQTERDTSCTLYMR